MVGARRERDPCPVARRGVGACAVGPETSDADLLIGQVIGDLHDLVCVHLPFGRLEDGRGPGSKLVAA
jgi:hypothetical protein